MGSNNCTDQTPCEINEQDFGAAPSEDSLDAMDVAILAEFENANLPDVSECLQRNQNAEVVQTDLSEGPFLGVNGTPAFFINGQPLSGAQPFPIFQQFIEQLLENS